MRNTLLASLLIGTASLVGAAADAAVILPLAARAPVAQSEAIAPAREAGEAARREDRRNDRRSDRRNDRRRAAIEQPADDLLVLVREGSSRNRGRRGV